MLNFNSEYLACKHKKFEPDLMITYSGHLRINL